VTESKEESLSMFSANGNSSTKHTKPAVEIEGLPWLVDYHIMNNKRYVLTVDSSKKVQLWECDTGRCIQEYTKTFSQVKKLL